MTQNSLGLLNFNRKEKNRATGDITTMAVSLGYKVVDYDIRVDRHIPDLRNHTKFIATGGPGDPREHCDEKGVNWAHGYHDFIDAIIGHNKEKREEPKDAFLICHSFQLLVAHLGIATLRLRDDQQLLTGIHSQKTNPLVVANPPHPCLANLPADLKTFENRHYQACLAQERDDFLVFAERGYPTGRAITGICSADGHIIGTQFHPEATSEGATSLLLDRREMIGELYGPGVYEEMVANIPELVVPQNMLSNFLRAGMYPA